MTSFSSFLLFLSKNAKTYERHIYRGFIVQYNRCHLCTTLNALSNIIQTVVFVNVKHQLVIKVNGLVVSVI